MKKEWLGTSYVEVYDSIEEMPITRWHKYQKFALIDGGIGSDLSSLDAHISRIVAFLKRKDAEKAITEIQNLRQNIFFIQQGIDPHLLSCACLIKSIDGKPCDDLTEEGLKKTIDKICDVPTNIFTAFFEVVKKKMEQEFATYFGKAQISSKEKEHSDLLRKRTLAVLDEIENGHNNKEQIDELTLDILTSQAPISFNGSRNFEVDFDSQFERMCVVLAQHTNLNPKQCSVMEFYHAYAVVKEQHKKKR